MYKVYIAKLKRAEGNPRTILKIGITSSTDAMNRLMYSEADESFPISKYFNDIKVMKSSKKIYTRKEAEAIESSLMNSIKGNDRYFHNWYETDQISGITEMRVWNYNEFVKACELLDLKTVQ